MHWCMLRFQCNITRCYKLLKNKMKLEDKPYKTIVREVKLLRQRIKKYGKSSLQFDVIKNRIIELESELKERCENCL